MRIEIALFIVVALIIANIYTDGKLLRSFYQYKKYYKMVGVVVGAIILYYLFKRHPERASKMIIGSNEYLKYMPIDRNTSSILSPILDFTSKYAAGSQGPPVLNLGGGNINGRQSYAQSRIMQSGALGPIGPEGAAGAVSIAGAVRPQGTKATKRSVSETKKKFVAAQQNWHCGKCGKQLPAWFEVDHKVRLEHGGSNHIDNLVALCRDCHGEKTALENL